jgi:hypothetical protein
MVWVVEDHVTSYTDQDDKPIVVKGLATWECECGAKVFPPEAYDRIQKALEPINAINLPG